jgi:hypothetical protein
MGRRFFFPQVIVFSLLFLTTIQGPAKSADDLAGTTGEQKNRAARLLDRLVAAYPQFLQKHDGKKLFWNDGTTMLFDDGRTNKSFDRLLNAPDLEDQFYTPYRAGKMHGVPRENEDPGRVRFQPFFTKMYGDCRKRQVLGKLKTIVWLPKYGRRRIKVTKVNNIAGKLQKISKELEQLIRRKPSMKKYLTPMSGTYNCRVIAGTKRYSVHAYGAAVDINVKQAHYWRWTKPGKGGLYPWRNKIPMEIVDIFERYGFIWGGKWYHYDTMHFEYRPELLNTKGAGKAKTR